MENKELISYAILSVNHSEKKDFLENFEPFILELVKKNNPTNISSTELREGLLEVFGLNIPNSIIKTICKNLCNKGFFEAKNIIEISDKYIYTPNLKKIDSMNMVDRASTMNQKFEELITKYRKYITGNFENNAEWDLSTDALISQIDAFVKENNINLVSKVGNKSNLQSEREAYLVANFVNYINKNDAQSYSTFLDIVKGNMISEALYFNDSGNFTKKFNGSKFYFDTSFMMYALGYSGEERKTPCIELLDLLKRNGANLYCFERNIREIRGILTWSKHHLDTGKDSHNTIEFFRNKGIKKDDIDIIISDLENTLENDLMIITTEDIEFDHADYSNVIDYEGLMSFLKQSIHYGKDEALENDVEAIASIMRLRKRKQPANIEDCGAVFVTTNGALCRRTKEYFISQQNTGIPPVLTDNILTNLVWLKNPQLYPELPSLRLIADCIAAVNPSDRLWNKYIDKLELLIADGEIIDTNKIVTLRYLPDAKKILMDKTMGDENAITDGTAKEVLAEIERQRTAAINEAKEQERNRAEKLVEKKEKEKKKLQDRLEMQNAEKKKTVETIKSKAEKKASRHVILIVVSISFFMGIASFLTLDIINIPKTIHIILSVIIGAIIPGLGIISNYLDLSFTSKIKSFQKSLSRKYFIRQCKNLGISVKEEE